MGIELPRKPLLRLDEVASYFDVNPVTVRDWYERGIIQGVNPGGRSLRIFRESIVKLIEQGEEEWRSSDR
jgi:hypothetical protein